MTTVQRRTAAHRVEVKRAITHSAIQRARQALEEGDPDEALRIITRAQKDLGSVK
jgi:hypothetical protein